MCPVSYYGRKKTDPKVSVKRECWDSKERTQDVSKACFIWSNMFDGSTATGQVLDNISSLWGLSRNIGETDDELRKRILDLAHGKTLSIQRTIILPEAADWLGYKPRHITIAPKPKCECGAHAVGFTEPGTGHSKWCPLSDTATI